MGDLTNEELADLRRLMAERQKVGDWFTELRPFDFGEWGPSTAALLAAAGNALPALLDMAERCAKAEKAATTVEHHSFTGTDRTYEDLLAKEKAAGELLRVARVSRDRTMSNEDYDDLCGAIDAAERAGVRP